MALLFSHVRVSSPDGNEAEFLVSGIPREFDDFEHYTTFEDFLDGIEEDTEITVHADAYLYGEGETYQASIEEVAYASMSDLTTHTVDDFVWITVFALAISSIPTIGLTSMLVGGLFVFIPQMALALIPPHKTLGGADIKLSTALAFLLGTWRGIGAYMAGLILAVVIISIYHRNKNCNTKQPFALVPFLSIGAMILFFV